MMSGPSPHLSWIELACRDGTAYPERWRTSRAVVLATEFERIRARVGRPILIGSSYRTPDWNRKVGGARASQHVEGRALDLSPPKGWTVERLHALILDLATDPESQIRGIGLYGSFVHFDIRPAPRLVHWTTGARRWAEGAHA